jgi:hypothetical protein
MGRVMHPRNLRTLTAIFLLAVGCTPSDPGTTDASTTDVNTTGTTTGNTTGEPTTNDTTGEPTTVAPTTSGASESATGSTGDESSTGVGTSTGTVEETSSSTGDGSSSTGDESSTGDAPKPVSFDECREGDNSMCPADDQACLVVDGPGGGDPNGSYFVTWSYCTRECDSDADCVSEEQGGTAKPLCVPKGPNQVKVCVLDCSFGKQCPDTLECSDDGTCGTRFCDCNGTGCQDIQCTGE